MRQYEIHFTDHMGNPRVWVYDRNNTTLPFNEALDIFREFNVPALLFRVDIRDGRVKKRLLRRMNIKGTTKTITRV